MNPFIETLLCLATLALAVAVISLLEATIGRWLRGRNRYVPPEPEPERPSSYDASSWAAWPEDTP